MNNLHSSYSGWLFRLAVDGAYRKRGIGKGLVRTVQNFCRANGYLDMQLAVSECQEDARQMFADCGWVGLVRLLFLFNFMLVLLVFSYV